MHLRILSDHQKHRLKFLKKIFFNVLSGEKRVLQHFCILPDHQNQVLKTIFFNVWSGKKRALVHLRILSDHQKHRLKNDVI